MDRRMMNGSGEYIRYGLLHMFDGINNTGNGHDGSATTWSDLIGSITLTKHTGGTWLDNALHFEPAAGTDTLYWEDLSQTSVYTQDMTIDVCIQPTGNSGWAESKSAVVVNVSSSANNEQRRIMLSAGDISVGGYTNGTNQFATTGLTTLRDIKHIAVTYTAQTGSADVYCNGAKLLKNANHTFGDTKHDYIYVGCSLGSSKYPYLGNIHSIRIYNRVLLDNEIYQNYLTDCARFFGG